MRLKEVAKKKKKESECSVRNAKYACSINLIIQANTGLWFQVNMHPSLESLDSLLGLHDT